MASAAQINANRVNAQASTGPVTDEGKAASARNSTRNGLAGRVHFMENEDPEEFKWLFQTFCADLNPANLTEKSLVFKMAESFWFSRRAALLLTSALELNTREDNSKQVSLLLRYQTSADRSFYRALNELRKLQKETPRGQSGFVSQNVPAPEQPAPAATPAAPPAEKIGFVSQKPASPPVNIRRNQPKIGRNELCPCGSGKKFKRCCLSQEAL